MMSRKIRLLRYGGLSILVGGLIGCSSLADWGIAVPYLGEPPLTVVQQLAQKRKGAIVYLKGIVGDYAPFLNGGAYLLKDQTGAIWIRTDTQIPKKGKEIVVKGRVDRQSILVGSQDVGEVYVEEMEQLDIPTAEASPSQPTVKPSPQQPTAKPIKDPTEGLFLPHKQQGKRGDEGERG